MLEFFRRHQRYFFVIITIVIVISFSFFGTFSAMNNGSFREQIAFKTINGTTITRHELDEMATFIATDTDDKQYFGGVWGLNFLNDGVIKKNFLETGLATMLIAAYADDVKTDFELRQEKERRYSMYTNPQSKFISVESAWNNFYPAMTTHFNLLRTAKETASNEMIQSRINLFLMERQFPPSLLRRVLKSQEQQYSWLKPDSNLDHIDLSIFGYHTLEDWFGPRFTRLASEFIINAAEIAENRGYYVAKADAMADLMRNAEVSFQQNANNPKLGVASAREYFDEQLRRLGMDRNTAAKVWTKVLLFRRLFQDMGSSVFVDPQTFAPYIDYILASADGDLYRLPKEFRLNSYNNLMKLEVYLDAISQRSESEKNKLKFPTTFLPIQTIANKNPELVQKRYLLNIAQIDKKLLEGNISLKETWAFETSDAGFEQLKQQFPELGLKVADTKDARYAMLDHLDDKTQLRIDAFARAAIVDSHPEWIDYALTNATKENQMVGIHEKGANNFFLKLTDGKGFMQLLDKAKENGEQLSHFTIDKNTHYRITVIDCTKEPEVLTFAEANQQGILDKLLNKELESYYLKIRDSNPKEFQRDDKNWKQLADVKEAVADRYFEKTIRAIRTEYATANNKEETPQQMIGEYAATLRLYPYMRDIKTRLEKDPSAIAEVIRTPMTGRDSSIILEREPLENQWKLESETHQTTRSSPDQLLDISELLALKDGTWTKVHTPANGDLNFFYLKQKGTKADQLTSTKTASMTQHMLSDDAQQKLMEQLLQEISDKKAISLQYLNQTELNESSE